MTMQNTASKNHYPFGIRLTRVDPDCDEPAYSPLTQFQIVRNIKGRFDVLMDVAGKDFVYVMRPGDGYTSRKEALAAIAAVAGDTVNAGDILIIKARA